MCFYNASGYWRGHINHTDTATIGIVRHWKINYINCAVWSATEINARERARGMIRYAQLPLMSRHIASNLSLITFNYSSCCNDESAHFRLVHRFVCKSRNPNQNIKLSVLKINLRAPNVYHEKKEVSKEIYCFNNFIEI